MSKILEYDKRRLGGRITSSRTRNVSKKAQFLAEQNASSYFSYFNYQREKENELADLFNRHGSDKTYSTTRLSDPYGQHTYSDLYESMFSTSRHSARRIFECGIGTNDPTIPSTMGIDGKPGASLRAWKDYFLNAEIYGADIDSKVLFTEERIRTFYVDQTDESSVEIMWDEIGVGDFDIMIDDGLHTPSAAKVLLDSSISRLKAGGLYIIEDILPRDFGEHVANLEGRFNFSIVMLQHPWVQTRADNNLLVVRN